MNFKSLICLFLCTLVVLSAAEVKKGSVKDTSTNKSANVTEKISDYFQNMTVMDSIAEKWNNFTKSIYSLFTKTPPKKKVDIHQHVSDFNRQIAEFLNRNMPVGNYTTFLDKFSDQMTEWINKAGINDKNTEEFMTKYLGFTDNITEFLSHGLFEKSDTFDKAKEKLDTFMDKVSGFFGANHTNFTEYIQDWTVRIFEKGSPIINYIYHHHEKYPYTKDYEKFSTCNKEQLDRCGHKCQQHNQVLCGCYVPTDKARKNIVDCVCADNNSMCEIKHYHKEAGKEPKKEM